ncbi:MAG TPA: replicative DNA helicase [Candidatus Kapabacteria bacterium]|nr:replicative DNA helicase [Candidatus Kapabacteria bacterium]
MAEKKEKIKSKRVEVISNRIPPHSNEAEQGVLCAMMLDRLAISKTVEILSQDSFYHNRHQDIYHAIISISDRGFAPDILTVREELNSQGKLEAVGGVSYLTELLDITPTSANIEQYARIVQEKYLKRLLITTSTNIIEGCYDDSSDAIEEIDKAEKHIFEIAEKRLKKSFTPINKLAKDTYKIISKMAEQDKTGLTGITTGFARLDDMLGGFQRSDLIIIAARPSMGKTALALSFLRNMGVRERVPVALFSIEMAGIQIVTRLISSDAKLDQHKIRTGRINHTENDLIIRSVGRLSDSPIFIDDSPMLSVMELRAKCRRLVAEHKVECVFVDYLQLMTAPKSESREREISFISSSLKQIAKELNIPVVALAQLNRSIETRPGKDKRPLLSDLRESGSIEQDADVVMFVNRPEQYNMMTYEDGTPTEGTGELIIGKQRNGPTGIVRVAFDKSCARFDNLEMGYEELPPDMNNNWDNDDNEYEDAPF